MNKKALKILFLVIPISLCSACEHKHNVVIDKRIEPTCTHDGLTEGSHCDDCNEIIVPQEVIPATGHSFKTTGNTIDNENKTGKLLEYVCSNCGDTKYESLDEKAYKVTFVIPDEAKVFIYEDQDYTKESKEELISYSKNSDTFLYSKDDAQINFRIATIDGYEVSNIVVNGDYKNIKNPEPNIYRITKIKTNITVEIKCELSISFSHESGFYDADFELEMNSGDAEIYYTLDGTIPTLESNKYNGNLTISDASKNPNTNSMLKTTTTGFLTKLIEQYSSYIPPYKSPEQLIDKCTVLRAASYKNGKFSKIFNKSYFVDFQNKSGYENCGVISLVTDPDNFFGYENGIYVMGKEFDSHLGTGRFNSPYWRFWLSNYSLRGKEYERPVNLTFFNEKQELIINKDCGARIHGGGSRGYISKSLNFYARKEYDSTNRFGYKFFDNDYDPQRMTLASGGDDYFYQLDDYLMSVLCGDANFTICKMKKYCLFIDGEFWGYYYLSEKIDKEYLEYYYGINGDDAIVWQDGEIEEGNESDIKYYNDMKDFISNNDMTNSLNYEKACEYLDIESYIEYFASFAYIGRNGDWPSGNKSAWRVKTPTSSKYSDGKWRYIMFDINSGAYSEKANIIQYIRNNDTMFNSLYENENFKSLFSEKILELAETRFNPEITNKLIDDCYTKFAPHTAKEFERFYDTDNYFKGRCNKLKTFFSSRYNKIISGEAI